MTNLFSLKTGQSFKFKNDDSKQPYRMLYLSRGGNASIVNLLTDQPSIIREDQEVYIIQPQQEGQ